ncbi:MAG TPA: hypothetical protein VN838_15720 [Bradyrhizobium sp.]|nr:hypothetical protein [Bradyrhizobium sp.]
MTLEVRQRLGKLFGRLGSDQAGERDNAIVAIDKALAAAGRGWSWVCELVTSGELPTDADVKARGALFAELVAERVRDCLAESWALSVAEAAAVGKVAVALDRGGMSDVNVDELREALRISTTMRRRVGRR